MKASMLILLHEDVKIASWVANLLSVASDSTELVDKTASQVYIKEQNLCNERNRNIWLGSYTRVLFSDKVGSSGHLKQCPLYICWSLFSSSTHTLISIHSGSIWGCIHLLSQQVAAVLMRWLCCTPTLKFFSSPSLHSTSLDWLSTLLGFCQL